MQLGIDFGTTRTVVAYADRGNYPAVEFTDTEGDSHDYLPSMIGWNGAGLSFGFSAAADIGKGLPVLRSVKRELASSELSTSTQIAIRDQHFPLLEVLTCYLAELKRELHSSSTISTLLDTDPITSVVVGVPAHANSAQRFLTLEAFRQAGFPVTAMINEPSAAGFEYTHRLASSPTRKRSRLVVYDLGGGTFDASLVSIHDRSQAVVGSVGVNRLGGDDFDIILADLACAAAGIDPDALGLEEYFHLLTQAQAAKEQLTAQSRKIVLDIADQMVVIPVAQYYEASTGLVEQTINAMTPLIDGLDTGAPDMSEMVGLYLVGGASSLPLIPRTLKETFGRRVYRSPYPAASTAIGLAIAADPTAGYTLADRLSRGFGVFREADGGSRLQFDVIFDRDQAIAADSEITITRRYRAAHNLGWYRFVEYANVSADGQPCGDIVPYGDVIFPLDQELQNHPEALRNTEVRRTEENHVIEESYHLDQHGIVSVTITDCDTGYQASHQLGLYAAANRQN